MRILQSVDTSTATPGGFPFWLLSLLAIPLLGAVLWWLLKSNGVPTPATAVASAPAPSRIVLTPRDSQNAYAYWEIPDKHLAEVKRQGGETMMIRIYDVTGRNKTAPLPVPTAEFPCLESTANSHSINPNQMQLMMTVLGNALQPILKQKQSQLEAGQLASMLERASDASMLASIIPLQHPLTQTVAQLTGMPTAVAQTLLPQMLPTLDKSVQDGNIYTRGCRRDKFSLKYFFRQQSSRQYRSRKGHHVCRTVP